MNYFKSNPTTNVLPSKKSKFLVNVTIFFVISIVLNLAKTKILLSVKNPTLIERLLNESRQFKCPMTSTVLVTFCVTQQTRCFCFDSFAHSSDTLYAAMTQAMWAILQYLYQPLKSC